MKSCRHVFRSINKARWVKGCSHVPIEQGRRLWCHECDAGIQLKLREGRAYFFLGKGPGPWKRFQWFLVLKPWESKSVREIIVSPPPASLASLLSSPTLAFSVLNSPCSFPLQCSEVFPAVSQCPFFHLFYFDSHFAKISSEVWISLGKPFLMPHSRSGFLCYKLSWAPTLPKPLQLYIDCHDRLFSICLLHDCKLHERRNSVYFCLTFYS